MVLSVNPLWSPPWATIDPHTYREPRHRRRYGSLVEGRLLSGIAGHSLCLDYFGIPSAEEVRHGLSLHGEAPSTRWRATRVSRTAGRVSCELRTRLPVAGLEFRRTITLRPGEQVVYFDETVRNTRKADHFFHWTQHVTLGPPFLAHGDAQIALPGTRALTFPHGYDEGKALLASNREFQWPDAPRADGSVADLTRTLIEPGLGFVVGVLLAESGGGVRRRAQPDAPTDAWLLLPPRRFPVGRDLGGAPRDLGATVERTHRGSWPGVRHYTAARHTTRGVSGVAAVRRADDGLRTGQRPQVDPVSRVPHRCPDRLRHHP